MGRFVEKTGKSVNDAIAAALGELGLSIDEVHVDVLDEGKAGFFGIISGKPAKVRVSELEEDERIRQPGYSGSDKAAAKPSGGANASDVQYRGDAGVEPAEASEYWEDDGESDGDGGVESGETETDDDGMAVDADLDIGRATDYLFDILNGIHVSANIASEPAEDGFLLNIESEDSGILIGHRGETLDALQYLVNLYMNKGRDGFIRITVDVENYKRKREDALKRLAERMAEKVVRLRRNFTLDAMNSYERRIIHSTLQNHPRVETYSVGEDPNRKVVVTLKSRGGYSSR